MPTFSFTIADAANATRAMNALCASAGVEPTQANALQVVKDWVRDTTLAYERSLAAQAAIAAMVEPVPIVPT